MPPSSRSSFSLYSAEDRQLLRWCTPSSSACACGSTLSCGHFVTRALCRRKPWRHLVQALLSLAELYGGWMTFAPEWVEGSPNLVAQSESLLRFWVHLVFMNGLWVLIPLVLLAESCVQIVRACDKAKTPAAGTALSAGWFHLCSLSLLAYAVLIPLIVGAIAMGKL